MSDNMPPQNRSLFQPWMFLLFMPMLGIFAAIFILTTDDSATNTLNNTNQAVATLDQATPQPRTLPPRTLPPTATSVFGNPVPQVSLRTLEGDFVTLADYSGKTIIINFWATWCPPCIEEMPTLQTFYEDHADDDVVLLLVTDPFDGQTEVEVREFVEELGLTVPIILSEYGQLNQLMAVRVLPSTYFIDANGITQTLWEGPIEIDYLQNEVARLIIND